LSQDGRASDREYSVRRPACREAADDPYEPELQFRLAGAPALAWRSEASPRDDVGGRSLAIGAERPDGIVTALPLYKGVAQMDMMIFWMGALTGGLAGTVFTHAFQLLGWFVTCPKLLIGFDENITGCRVEKERNVYFRIMVQNSGRSTAKDVKILYSVDESEIYNMNWAGLGSDTADIPSKTYRFCDIYRLSLDSRELQIEAQSDAKRPEFSQDIEIYAYVFATSSNGASTRKYIQLRHLSDKTMAAII
jgi:hypothetical protein